MTLPQAAQDRADDARVLWPVPAHATVQDPPAAAPPEPAGVALPAELERYLPASLWRQLAAEAAAGQLPRRGLLLTALDRLRSVLHLLSSFLPAHLVQEKMRRPSAGIARGQMVAGTLLFSDVSGFTALSERLAVLEDGAERLTGLMNAYFERMLQILSRSGGTLLKFAGDALLAYFPQQDGGEQARRAVRAARRMIDALAEFATLEAGPHGETIGLKMKVGLGTGSFLSASVGGQERMEYVILGEAVGRTMGAEAHANAGEVVGDEATAALLDASWRLEPAIRPGEETGGFLRAMPAAEQPLDDFEVQVESRRARGAIPWSASPHALVAQMEVVLHQIQALVPFLAPELVERVVAAARQRDIEGEYRSTTTLFANVTGLEQQLAAWGPEGVRRATQLLDDYFRAMQHCIAHHGGIVSRVDPYREGSKVLILFGAPVAHEDDPLRAVQTALAMQDELAALNERWQLKLARGPVDDGPLLRQRIGVTRGETFAGRVGSARRHEYTVMGDDVNLAARLMSAAAPGEILVSQRVYTAIADRYLADALPPIRVKGKSQPIPIYRPTGPRDDPLARRLQARTPLVGREGELGQVRQAVDRWLAGQGSVLVLRGGPGIGKSRLADEAAALALAHGARIVLVECRAYNAESPYAPWIAILNDLLGLSPAASAEAAGERLQAALAGLGLAADRSLATLLGLPAGLPASGLAAPTPSPARPAPVPDGGPTLFGRLQKRMDDGEGAPAVDLWQLARKRPAVAGGDAGPQGHLWRSLQARVADREEQKLHESVRRVVTCLAAARPLLILIDGAQWLDAASIRLIETLAGRLAGTRLLLLVLQRDEEVGRPVPPLACGATLALSPLDAATTARLAAGLLERDVEPDLAAAIYDQSAGNPLYVQEIARGLRLQGAATAPALLDGLRRSPTLHDLLLSHLDCLPPGQRDLVRLASVVGIDFERAALRVLAPPAVDDVLLDEDLLGLERAALILLAAGAGQPDYAFRQALFRDAVYRSQSFARRRELHGALATFLQARHAGARGQHAELLAHHFELAGRPLAAAHFLLLAGHKACQRFAYRQAASLYGRALAILQALPPGKTGDRAAALLARAHEGQGDTALRLDDLPAAARAYRAAQEAVPGQEPPSLLLRLALVLPLEGRVLPAKTQARRAWEAGSRLDLRLAAAVTLAWIGWRSRGMATATWLQRGRSLARQAPADDFWMAGTVALLADLAGDWPAAEKRYLALDRPTGAALAACRQGDRLLRQGDPAAAQDLYERAAGLWLADADGTGLALARFRQAEVQAARGELPAARKALREARELLAGASAAAGPDRQAVDRALALLDAGPGGGPWPAWRWQQYDDAFRLSILLLPAGEDGSTGDPELTRLDDDQE